MLDSRGPEIRPGWQGSLRCAQAWERAPIHSFHLFIMGTWGSRSRSPNAHCARKETLHWCGHRRSITRSRSPVLLRLIPFGFSETQECRHSFTGWRTKRADHILLCVTVALMARQTKILILLHCIYGQLLPELKSWISQILYARAYTFTAFIARK